jgi:predicted transcriptional regulator
MSLNLPSDITAWILHFIDFEGYQSQEEVLRDALAALEHEINMAAIQAGMEDEEAGRIRPWAEVKEELRARLGREPRAAS